MKKNYWAKLAPGHYYHVYNRANRCEQLLFKTGEQATLFLSKWKRYSQGFFDTYAYCLMPNHFHFVIKVKPLDDQQLKRIGRLGSKKAEAFLLGNCTSNDFYASIFQAFLKSYASTINNLENQRGSIFQSKFKRTLLPTHDEVREKIQYTHRNPIHHRFCSSYHEWPHSSYNLFLNHTPTWVEREEVLKLYQSLHHCSQTRETFVKMHWDYAENNPDEFL